MVIDMIMIKGQNMILKQSKGVMSFFLLSVMLMHCTGIYAQKKDNDGMISGRVISSDRVIIDFATVLLKDTTCQTMSGKDIGYKTTTNKDGLYHLIAPEGKYILVVSAMGYKTVERTVELKKGERKKLNIKIEESFK